MGFRRFLNRQPAVEKPPTTPPVPFAQPTPSGETAPLPVVPVEKKSGSVAVGEKRLGVRRVGRRPSYVWVSQASRELRLSWADQLNRPF